MNFRDPALARRLLDGIDHRAPETPVRFMEVCGTHTMAIFRHGIRNLLPPTVRLISGPGCPVCVTPSAFLDRAILLSRKGYGIATYGDLLRVPGSLGSLEEEAARGARIKVVTSPLDALAWAEETPVIFLGVGFETTTPGAAAALRTAKNQGIKNFKVLSAHKVMPPPMKALVEDRIQVDGFLCPGHVSAVIGSDAYRFLSPYRIPSVVAGFEPVEILASILTLLEMRQTEDFLPRNLYPRVVRSGGNPTARALIEEVFEPEDAVWRGLGIIPGSGLRLREAFQDHDASLLPVELPDAVEPKGCRCGEILKGLIDPEDCPLFGKVCVPEKPVGACMVSSEGTCAAAYRYGRVR